MISKKMESALNAQITREIFSSYLYLGMSIWARSLALEGSAKWLRMQAAEEMEHAHRLIEYIEDQNGVVTLEAIEKPEGASKNALEAFTRALEHERFVTRNIHELCALADAEKDFATKEMLSWFVKEQVEEEATAQLIVDRLSLIGESKGSLLFIDKELGKRAKE